MVDFGGFLDKVLDFGYLSIYIKKHSCFDHPEWLGDKCGADTGLNTGICNCVHKLITFIFVKQFPLLIPEYHSIFYIQKKKAIDIAWLNILM